MGKKSLMKITSFLLGWRRSVLLSNTENPIFGTHIRSPSPLSSLPGREAERTSESDRRAYISVKHNNNKALQNQSNNNFCVNPYIGKRQGKKVSFLSSYFFLEYYRSIESSKILYFLGNTYNLYFRYSRNRHRVAGTKYFLNASNNNQTYLVGKIGFWRSL